MVSRGSFCGGRAAPKDEPEVEKIPEADFSALVERFKQVLGERVTDVRASRGPRGS